MGRIEDQREETLHLLYEERISFQLKEKKLHDKNISLISSFSILDNSLLLLLLVMFHNYIIHDPEKII